jgi:cell division protein FtsA
MKRIGSVMVMDIGSQKIRTAVLQASQDLPFDIIHIGEYDSDGFSSGAVTDLKAASASLRTAITGTLGACSLKRTTEIWVGHSGSHVRSDNIADQEMITSTRVVTQRNINKMKVRAAGHVPAGHTQMHSFLRSSSLDGILTRAPAGLTGNRLVSRFHLVYTSISIINNIKQAFQKAGYNVNRFIFNGYAASLSVIDNSERMMGCLVINLGATTCDYIVYQEGQPFLSGSLNEGWQRLAKDVAIGVQIPYEQAEQLIHTDGSTSELTIAEDRDLNVKNFFGDRSRLTRRHLSKIMGCAIEEMFCSIRDNLKGSVCRGHLPAGIILTGGGALTSGLTYSAENVFGVMAKVGDPIIHGESRSFSPSWAPLLGLLVHAKEEFSAKLHPETVTEYVTYPFISLWDHMFPTAQDPKEPEGEATI